MSAIKKLTHWLFGCAGYFDHEADADGIYWFGLRCATCGKLKRKKRSRFQNNTKA